LSKSDRQPDQEIQKERLLREFQIALNFQIDWFFGVKVTINSTARTIIGFIRIEYGF
jgi:hypothetical protein